jgi:hypothetical protein
LREDSALREALYDSLQALLNTEEYQQWLVADQFSEERFVVPSKWPDKVEHRHLLEMLALIRDDQLRVKIEQHGNTLCMTDGLWVPPRYRVFPFTDESTRLLEYLAETSADGGSLLTWPTAIVDLAAGSGHHPVFLSNIKTRIALDLSIRAQAYCVLNKYLNGQGEDQNFFIGTNDVRRGLPDALIRGLDGQVLFVVNMPFAISPLLEDGGHALPLSTDGGEAGADLTIAALRAIREAMRSLPAAAARACVLNYSVGQTEQGPWLVREIAETLFGREQVRFTVLSHETMWRINGKKEQPNPMPISSLSKKAECKYYVTDDRREEIRRGYKEREKQLQHAGWNFLSYGVVDITLR